MHEESEQVQPTEAVEGVEEPVEQAVAAEPEPAPAAEPEPAPAAEPDAEVIQLDLGPAHVRIPWWPFLTLGAVWIALSGAAAYLLTRNPDLPSYAQRPYPAIVIAGVSLMALGPILAAFVWLVVWNGAPPSQRGGLFSTAFVRGAAITLFGVLAWWGTLVVVDALRVGLIRI